MDNDEKQIEEMAKFIPNDIVRYDGMPRGQHLYIEQKEEITKALYEQGYRKITEGSVVLTKEEYKILYNDERANYYRAENLAIENDLLNKKLMDARKEMAREIIGWWKNKLPHRIYANGDHLVTYAYLDELAKQYGVDIEE